MTMGGTADLVLTDARLPGRPEADTVVIADGRIVAVGAAAEVRDLIGAGTDVRPLGGRTVIPAFQDAHVHPLTGGLEMLRCDLTDLDDRHLVLEAVAAYAAGNPGASWITGGGWRMDAFPGGTPLAADLDAIVADRPVFLPNRDHHGAWVNSRALELAGITASTPDPADGRIERDERGAPSGVLHEGAMRLVQRLVPAPTLDEQVDAMLTAQRHLHALGITAWQDAIVGDYPGTTDPTRVYHELISRGLLTARVRGCLWWRRDRGVEQLDDLLHLRTNARPGLALDAVKIMQDGVCENFTAATLTPYLGGHGSGISFFEPGELAEAVTRLHGAGLQVHFHTIGERAVREALDAVAAALDRHGPRDLRHHLAHLQIVHPDDVPRFAELGVAANMQPLWAYNDDQMTELTVPFLGEERAGWQYPFAALHDHGTRLAMGSDWPVSSADPILGIHVAVNRTTYRPGTDPARYADQPFLPHQRLTLETALRAATLGSAYVNHLDASTGTLDPSKHADLAVLDRDPFALPPEELHTVRVVTTVAAGRIVHDS
ncbi:amidohydrolase [Actinomadura fulvescens]|uniref:Amidohydrolase n=1 Tax=Actinomadura fulvescens TaxID=46160 RepID=A0ABP6CIU9_9ACTN